MQCSTEILVILTLASFWTTQLLVIFSILFQDWQLIQRSGVFFIPGYRYAKGIVVKALGPDQLLTRTETTQVGRVAKADRIPTILFHDRARKQQVFPGRIRFEDPSLGECEIQATSEDLLAERTPLFSKRPLATETLTVWENPKDQKNKACTVSAELFDKVWNITQKGTGWTRVVESTIRQNDAVWVGYSKVNGSLQARVISTFDPRPRAYLRTGASLLGVFASFLVGAIVTYLPFHFGMNSLYGRLGGVLGVANFALIQPFGVWFRNYLKTPDQASLDGLWRKTWISSLPTNL